MKRFAILGLALCCMAAVHAQVVQDNELAVVYYMPETHLVFDVEYTVETLEAGPFFLFAERYLGTDDVIQEDATRYHLTGVKTATRTLPDYTRAYKVVPEKGIPQLLSLTDRGLLYGYNVPRPTDDKRPADKPKDKHRDRRPRTDIVPLLEEQITAPTLQQRAEGAAKQIYRIRETRMYILSGEIDHAPADGEAMALVLNELDRQEQLLTELFVGKRTVRRCHKTLTYIPTKSEEIPLLYFSEENGITAEDDASAAPLLLTIVASKQVKTAGFLPDKKAPQPSQIVYNLPGSADYAVNFRGELLAERTLPIAQFGIAVPLAKELFQGDAKPRIYFDTKTGNIRSIRQ